MCMLVTPAGNSPCPTRSHSAGSRHPATLLCTTATRFRAGLAVRMRVPCAFCAACFAYLRAEATEVHRELAVACHERGRQSANRCAVHVKTDALRHHIDVPLLQTRARAVVASIGAGVTRFGAGLIVLGTHLLLLWRERLDRRQTADRRTSPCQRNDTPAGLGLRNSMPEHRGLKNVRLSFRVRRGACRQHPASIRSQYAP
jgi:hypothetical protein